MLMRGYNGHVRSGVEWQLSIAAGPNAGALVALNDGVYRLGRATDNDVVLADTGVAREQAVIEIDDDGARVTALAAGVRVQSRRLEAGQATWLKASSTISIGATVLRVEGPRRGAFRGILMTAGLVTIICAGVAVGSVASRSDPLNDAPSKLRTSASPASALAAAGHGAAAESLRVHLASTSLRGLKIEAVGGAVIASGTVAHAEAWHDAKLWFDGQFGGRVALVDRVQVTAESTDVPRIAIRAVSVGEVPYFVAGTGERYTEGAMLDGWAVTRIERTRIVLQRDGRQIDVTL